MWTSEVNFKSECLAGSQDIKGCFSSLEKHYLLSQFQRHLTGTILINKLITQITETFNFSQLLFGRETRGKLRGRSRAQSAPLPRGEPVESFSLWPCGHSRRPSSPAAPGRAQPPWQRTLHVGGLLGTVLSELSEGHQTTRAAVSTAEGPLGSQSLSQKPWPSPKPLALHSTSNSSQQ